MKRLVLAAMASCFVALAGAATPPYDPAPSDVLAALSQRSGRTEKELADVLADCDADQASLYFCAYRDLIISDMKLQRAVGERNARFPRCEPELTAMLTRREATRNRGCAQSSARAYGAGSMAPTARLLCMQQDFAATVKRVQHLPACRRR